MSGEARRTCCDTTIAQQHRTDCLERDRRTVHRIHTWVVDLPGGCRQGMEFAAEAAYRMLVAVQGWSLQDDSVRVERIPQPPHLQLHASTVRVTGRVVKAPGVKFSASNHFEVTR